MEIKTLTTNPELEKAFLVMKELRPHLDFNQFMSLYQTAKSADQYTIVAAAKGDEYLGVMGYRILYDYVHGKHLYIDDLVVSSWVRSQGIGKKLLKFAEQVATQLECKLLRLSTGTENERGKAFYEREGWTLRSVTYKKLNG